ncbi:MAG: ABC transporter substrate-binding protein [Actinobacteria bacterium]|nr:ABC transporter substrate-binding protein [Actinomycetota bacterium]
MKKTLIALAAASALLLSGCAGGASTPTPAETGGAALTPVKVAVVPVADVAPIYLGVEQGFFKEEGLDVTLQNAQGAAAAVPLLLNGEIQFAYGALIPMIPIVASGVPAQFVVGGIAKPASPEEDYSALIVAKDSGIESLSELAGKRVAINALRGGPHLSTVLAFEAAGVDPNTVEFVELPMADGMGAVDRGDVDAAYLAEPFTSQAVAAGYPVVSSPVYETAPDGPTSGYFSVLPFIEGNEDTVDAFVRAMEKSVEYANSHTDEVRAQIAEYSGMDAAAVASMRIPTFTSDSVSTGLKQQIDQLVSVGWLENAPDAASMVR